MVDLINTNAPFLGEVPMPFFSMYNASKAAVKMFTESLAYEVKDWGVKVSLVAPSAFKTGKGTVNQQRNPSKQECDDIIRTIPKQQTNSPHN